MDFAHVELDLLLPPKFLLRPVRKNTTQYTEMLDSIKKHGVLQPILVRPAPGGRYEVVEGNYRYTCSKQLRLPTVPCTIREMTDEEVLIMQVMANAIRPETRPVEFAERLYRLTEMYPHMTAPKLAIMLCKSPSWVRDMLHLRRLGSDHATAVRRGEMPLQSACALARLPLKAQDGFAKQAKELPSKEFVKIAGAELKRYREAVNNAFMADHKVNQSEPVPHLRTVPEIRSEYETKTAALDVLKKSKAETAEDGWNACLAWILHMDPDGLKDQYRMIESRMKQQIAAEERRKKERKKLQALQRKAENNKN